MRAVRALPAALAVVLLAVSPALATKYYYVGGPLPGTTNDGSWQHRASGLQAAYDWIQANGAGDDWDVRVHADYAEDVLAGSITIGLPTVTVNRVQGAMTWQTGPTGPLNVAQDLTNKSEVTGTGSQTFLIHNILTVLDGFRVNGSVFVSANAGGSRIQNCHLHGLGADVDPREGLHIHDHGNKVYVVNTLVEGFETGLRYLDNVAGRTVCLVHCTIADNAVGISNNEAPWIWAGQLQSFNTIIAAANTPVELTANKRFYACSDVFDGDGSFGFDGVNDIDLGGCILSDPKLGADYRLQPGSPCEDTGGTKQGTTTGGDPFWYVDVDPTTGFQASADVVVAGTPPPGAQYVYLGDIVGSARLQGGNVDMGAHEGAAAARPVPEPSGAAFLVLGLAALRGCGRRRREQRNA